MKYTININQKAIIDMGLDLDLIDLAVFDYIKDLSNYSKIVKIEIEGKTYFWVQYQHLIDNMPLLGINNKKVLLRRIDKLIIAGLLEKRIINGNSTYFKFGINYDKYVFSEDEEKKVTECYGKVKGGVTEKGKGVLPKSNSINYNNNNYNNNNYIYNENFQKNSQTQISFLDKFKNEIIDNEEFIRTIKNKYSLTDENLKNIGANFCLYRTEKNENGKKEKWQKEKTFDIRRRFFTRLQNEQKFSRKQNETSYIEADYF